VVMTVAEALEAKSRAEGEARGEARALLRVAAKRGIALSPEQEERIRECTDLKLLERWLDQALVATSADELFTSH